MEEEDPVRLVSLVHPTLPFESDPSIYPYMRTRIHTHTHFSGFSLSLVAGLFYGFQFLPVQYMKLCDDDSHSCNGRYGTVAQLVKDGEVALSAIFLVFRPQRNNRREYSPSTHCTGTMVIVSLLTHGNVYVFSAHDE